MLSTTEKLHRWAFWELGKGNKEKAWRIIRVVTRRKIRYEIPWIESKYAGGKPDANV